MKSLLLIAWRNVWRHKLRSAVVIMAILVGIWAGVFVSAFNMGLNKQRTENIIENQLSHLQVHHPQWPEQNQVTYSIPQAVALYQALQNDDKVASFSARTIANGMIASAHYTGGVQLMGVDREHESQVTHLAQKVREGTYFEQYRSPVLVGAALAEKLAVDVGSRVVITFTDSDNNVVSAAFKVAGVYTDFSSQLEKTRVYLRQSDLQKLLQFSGQQWHELAIKLKEPDQALNYAASLQKQYPSVLVESWQQLSPDLAYADELMSQVLYLIIGIIMLALSFGIVNTMLMAVLERRKELGMLMSIGMNKKRLFAMILLETLYLALLGGPLGIFAGYITVELSAKSGISLSMFSEGLASFGINSVIYPSIESQFYWGTGLIVMLMTLLAALYPAFHALKLNPVQSIRTI